MRDLRLIIFDWDGTLVDSAAQIVASMQQAIAALGWPERDPVLIRELIGLGLDDVLRRLYPEEDPRRLKRLLFGYRDQWLRSNGGEAPLFSGVLEAVSELRGAGYGLAVATGKSRAGLTRSLAHHHRLAPLLGNSRTADESADKPHPLMLEQLLREAGLRAEQALMVGDTDFDIEMAHAIGMPAVAVTGGAHQAARLHAARPRALLESVARLPRWLRQI